MAIIEEVFFVSLSLQEVREEGVLSHMEQLFAIIAQGVGAHSGKYSIHKVTVISS